MKRAFIWRIAFAVAFSGCTCGRPPLETRDAPQAPTASASIASLADAGSAPDSATPIRTESEEPSFPKEGTKIEPGIRAEEDDDSHEVQLVPHGLPALSEDGKLLALAFSSQAVASTAEQSLVIVDVQKCAEKSRIVLVKQSELAQGTEDNPTKALAAIRARISTANELLKKNAWKAPLYKEGTEVDLGDDEAQPPIELGPWKLEIDANAHQLVLRREGNKVLSKEVRAWASAGKALNLSDVVLVPSSDTAGLLVLTSSELDNDANPRHMLRIVGFGTPRAIPSP